VGGAKAESAGKSRSQHSQLGCDCSIGVFEGKSNGFNLTSISRLAIEP
jgi:hypothetical protein